MKHPGDSGESPSTSIAEEHLRSLVDLQLKSLPRDGQIHQAEGSHALKIVDEVGTALVSVKAIDESAARQILYDFRDTLVSLGFVDPKTLPGGALGYQEPVGPPSWNEAPRRPESRPLRVIPVVKDLGPVPGAKSAVLISTEIWTDHLRMRSVLFRPDDEGAKPPNWAWRLRDDLGTVYRSAGGSAGGGSSSWMADQGFQPAPPKEATKLIIFAHRIGDSPHPEPPGAMWGASGPVEEQLFSVEIPLSEQQPSAPSIAAAGYEWPVRRVGACAVFLDNEGWILILKPTYRKEWVLPGGLVEANETPRQGCLRELKEELGTYLELDRLLCVEHTTSYADRPEGIMFVFLGRPLTPEDLGNINLATDEVSEFVFLQIEEALGRLTPRMSSRLRVALKGLEEGRVIYSEDGAEPFDQS